MSGNAAPAKERQNCSSDKKPVMVYLPEDLLDYLERRQAESGLSMSAFFVFLLRSERSKLLK